MEIEVKYKVIPVPMKEVFADSDFNCRGQITPFDVRELAADIAIRGLDQPITVVPYDILPYKFKVAAGHRRYMAFKVNKQEFIPAMVRTDLTETDARLLNLSENVHREDLNILQEARGMNWFVKQGWQEDTIAARLGMSRGWVQVRKILLGLPEDIQEVAAAGILNQQQIRNLYSMRTNEERYEAVRRIKDAKERNEKVDITPKKKPKPHEKRVRTPAEMLELQDYIQEEAGNNLATRLLGWCGGYVSTLEIHRDIREFVQAANPKTMYRIPKDVLENM